MFDLERFVADCRQAAAQGGDEPAIRELVARAVSEPGAVLKALGEPRRAGIYRLYCGEELTILNLVWGPYMTIRPHNHQMWGVIGIYTGREDNIFWRRVGDNGGAGVEAAGARALSTRDCMPMGRELIHSVNNPIPRLTGAIHVYGGDFFNEPRSEWDPESLVEAAFSVEHTLRLFEESNTRLAPG